MTRQPNSVPKHRRSLLLSMAAAVILGLLIFRSHIKPTEDSAALRPVLFVQTQGAYPGVQFSPDSRFLITTEGEAEHFLITFRDTATGQIVRQRPAGGETGFSDDGKRILEENNAPNGPTHYVLRDAATGHALRQWTGQIGDILPDFTLMTLNTETQNEFPKTGRVVEVATGRVIGQFSLLGGLFDAVRLSRHGSFLCLTSDNKPARLLRLPKMTSVLPNLPPLQSLRVTQDGSRAYGVSQDGRLHFWSLPSGQHTSLPTGLNHTDWATEMEDGTFLISGAEGTPTRPISMIQVRSSDGKRVLRSRPGSPEAFSPDGRLLAFDVRDSSGTSNIAYDIWDAMTGTHTARLDTATDALGQPTNKDIWGIGGHLTIAPDGRHFAYATENDLLRLYSLVDLHGRIEGYNLFNLMRASAVVNRQFVLTA